MTFDEVLDQVRELLRTRRRVTYQALTVRFALDDAWLEGLKAELIEAEQVAADENGRVLVWVGGGAEGETAKGENGEKQVARCQSSAPSP